ncbi:DNA recombination-mediator protein A [Amycolatopsis marina]|uniref:DNA recombination-mediator protein A n=1 Tax=Amycolatopsis marina TaxID=490629 RepID=A0A1I1CPF1_9PSEU|nr:DNA-processing protein DprA [Amycolatopsis marina]TWE14990.1 DNA recombination-mediator protein A [Prauserella muralis]SDU62841.1 DNA recombination-mediator protein A [Amycolatopsis keratiniphila]SFB64589.1 DNA recombination-mediator protein A [Amycolatopsis marina]
MPRHVTITGTRSITAQAETQLTGLFDDYLRPFADPNATFYLGGAAGIDTSALDWLAEHTQAALTVVVPCTVADQPAVAGEAIHRWQRGGRLAGVVELRAEKLGSSAYHARNRWMVDRSGFVIGFPQGSDSTSGTWYTVNYAADQGKPRLVVPV